MLRCDPKDPNYHGYTYNDQNQRTIHERLDSTVGYGYDAFGQLTNASAGRLHEEFRYAYDLVGNLTNRIQNVLTQAFTVNNLNQLTGGNRSGKLTVAGTTTSPATNVTVNGSIAVLYADYTFASTNHTLV